MAASPSVQWLCEGSFVPEDNSLRQGLALFATASHILKLVVLYEVRIDNTAAQHAHLEGSYEGDILML